MTDMPMRPAPPVRYAEIEYGDTLHSIALREMGDAGWWIELAVVNELRPPYVAERPGPGVLAYGETVKIPAGVSLVDASSDPADVYGTDLLVGRDGHLRVEAGDLALLSGVANLSAALQRRVLVDKKELAFHPSFGCYARRLLGRTSGPTAAQLAAFYVKSSLLEDSRVREVVSCVAVVRADSILVDATVQPITGKPAELKVMI